MQRNRPFVSFLVLLIALTLVSCGGGGDSSSGHPGGGNTGGLTGDPAALAVTATTDRAPRAALAADVASGVILTKLDVILAQGATVGQVNAALAAVDGTIVHMSAGSPFLTVGVPRQADAAALAVLAQVLQSQPGIAAASPGREGEPKVLPDGAASTLPGAIPELDHLLPTRFPAAWNAMRHIPATCDPVTVLIADTFGSFIDDTTAFNNEIPDIEITGEFTDDDEQHGYQVATTLAAGFDAANPTGAAPFFIGQCVDLIGVQMGGLTVAEQLDAIAAQMPATGEKFILNYAWGNFDRCPKNAAGIEDCQPAHFGNEIPTPWQRGMDAMLWWQLTKDRRPDFLVASAAGNEAGAGSAQLYRGLAEAAFTSPINLSTRSYDQLILGLTAPSFWDTDDEAFSSLAPSEFLMTQLEDAIAAAGPYEPAPNVLTVGGATSAELFENLAVWPRSDLGPDVNAVSENIFVLGAASDQGPEGTSLATAQVAGLATYLWLLSPTLRSADAEATAFLMKSNTRSNANVSGVIDAYAAVLSLDQAVLVTPTKAKIRHAILDVDGNGGFDGLDLLQFAEAYHLDDPSAPQPTARDYSRYDLNGDGYTGGLHIDRFDLDRVGSEQFGPTLYNTAVQTIEGYEINMNENALSDKQILCYYAYSPLYQGDESERTDILGVEHCVGAQLEAMLAAFSGGSAPLNMTVTDKTGEPLPDVYLELTATGGTVSPSSGNTDSNGTFSTTATLDSGSTSLTVVVTARTEPGGEILDQETVTGLTGSVKLVERMHRGTVDHNPLFEHEIHEVGYQGTTDSLEPYSDSSNPAAHTVTQEDGDGNTYSVTVSGGITQSVSFGSDGNGNISSITGSAVFDVTANATAGGTSRTVHGSSVADMFGGDNSVEIAVEGAPVAYTLSGNLNVTSSSSDLFPRTKADGYVSIGLSHIDVCSDTNGGCVNEITGAPIPATADLASSGILQPGRHKLALDLGGDAICSTYVEVLTCTSTASGSYNFTLTFSPAP